jgi:xanthine dehydrogenase accessory factor
MTTPTASLYRDEVITPLAAWLEGGHRAALVTICGIDGTSPRPHGAQMAVREDGTWTGYISGGCLEAAIAEEAAQVIAEGKPRLIRYGKGSPYFDIKLPCGSGLDLLITPALDRTAYAQAARKIALREPFSLTFDVSSADVTLLNEAWDASEMRGNTFIRPYQPALRLIVIGSSPIAACIADLSRAAGFDVWFYGPAGSEAHSATAEAMPLPASAPYSFPADARTAAVVAFHDHDREPPVFEALLGGNYFAITAIGSRSAHQARLQSLASLGYGAEQLDRIVSPAGLIPGLKAAPHVAISILAGIVEAAKSRGYV